MAYVNMSAAPRKPGGAGGTAIGAGTGGALQTQVIGGKPYQMYSPEWYAARDANKVQQAGVAGTAAGTAFSSARTASGLSTPGGGGTGLPPQVGAPGSGGTTPGTLPGGIGTIGVDAAQNAGEIAAMNRAKERAGLMARSALTGLRSTLGERGLLAGPSGIEAGATADVANEGLQQLSDVNREQAIQGAQAARAREALQTQAGVAMRGQDVTQRGQDIQAQLQREGFGMTQQEQLQNAVLAALRNQLY